MWLAVACLLVLAWSLGCRYRQSLDRLLPSTGVAADALDGSRRERARRALDLFDATYQASFRGCSSRTVMDMYALRSVALEELRDAEMRLPADALACANVRAAHDRIARTLHAKIENVKRRAGFYGYRGPIDDMYETGVRAFDPGALV